MEVMQESESSWRNSISENILDGSIWETVYYCQSNDPSPRKSKTFTSQKQGNVAPNPNDTMRHKVPRL